MPGGRRRLLSLAGIIVVALPAAALGGTPGHAVRKRTQPVVPGAPSELQKMMANPSTGMDAMMSAPGMKRAMKQAPQGMERMMNSPGMERMMGGSGAASP